MKMNFSNEALSVLTDRERYVVTRHWGINYDYQSTLDEIAKDLKLTRERVRQIRDRARGKLNV